MDRLQSLDYRDDRGRQAETPSRLANGSKAQKSTSSFSRVHDSLIEDSPERPLIPALRSFHSINAKESHLTPRPDYKSEMFIKPGLTLSL